LASHTKQRTEEELALDQLAAGFWRVAQALVEEQLDLERYEITVKPSLRLIERIGLRRMGRVELVC
jgi:hypothetical protein